MTAAALRTGACRTWCSYHDRLEGLVVGDFDEVLHFSDAVSIENAEMGGPVIVNLELREQRRDGYKAGAGGICVQGATDDLSPDEARQLAEALRSLADRLDGDKVAK